MIFFYSALVLGETTRGATWFWPTSSTSSCSALPVALHLHNDVDVVNGEEAKGLQQGLPAKLEAETELPELEPTDPLRFRWGVSYHG